MSHYYQVPRFCGVYYLPTTTAAPHPAAPSWLPQVSLISASRLYDTAASTVLTQIFVNPSKTSPIERAKYNFPLYEACAVVAFRCRIGVRRIEGVVREKAAARAEYDAAVARGETAGLLEQQAPDVFSTALGNIPAGATVAVEITYIMELKHDAEADGLRFTIPTSIAPRYGQAPSGLDTYSDGQPIPGALQRGMAISVQLTMPSSIRAVQSPSHTLSLHLGGHAEDVPDADFNPKHALATLSQTSTELGKDFVLLVKCADLSSPRALLETHPTLPNSKALMVTLVPKFTLPPGPKPEIVFIVDRSGSMVNRIAALVSALSVFLRSLPVGVKFNICSFGSKCSFLWEKSQPYSWDTLDEAQKHVESMAANFGGTEILEPVKATVKQRFKDIPLEMMVLTDGEVWNTQELFMYLEKETATGDIRLFSLGIGQDVSHALVEGMARVGRGFAQVVLDETEGIEGKVVRMLRAALSAHIKDYRLEWDSRPPEQAAPAAQGEPAPVKGKKISLFDTKADADTPISPKSGADRYAHLPDFAVPAILQAPYKLPSLFPFSRSTAYVILSGDVPAPSSVWLRGTTPSGDELELEIAVEAVPEKARTIHQLAARKILQELEEGRGYMHSGKYGVDPEKNAGTFGEWVAREGTRVGVTYGLAGKWTSFVAVEKKKGKAAASEEKSVDVERTVVDPESAAMKEKKFLDVNAMMDSDSDDEDGEYDIIDDGVQSRNESARYASSGSPPPRIKTKMRTNVPTVGARTFRDPYVLLAPTGWGIGEANRSSGLSFGGPAGPSAVPTSSPAVPPSAAPMRARRSSPEGRGAPVVSREQVKTLSPRDQAMALIALQTFEGSFPLSAALAAALGARLADLEAKLVAFAPAGRGLPAEQRRRLWATVLAVRMFEGKLRGEKEVWELVAEKAREWVGLSAAGDDVTRLEAMARAVLGG